MRISKLILVIGLSVNSIGCKKNTSVPDPELAGINLLRGEIVLCGPEQFGEVSFSQSCDEKTRDDFDLAVSLLHSFEYDEAEKAFVKVIDMDPDCAMAYWGVSMSIFHSLWMQSDLSYLEKGEKLLKIANRLSLEEKEKDYLDAIGVFYTDWKTINHQTRKALYEKKMELMYDKYKNDTEIAVFYALSLSSAADPKDKTYSKQIKSGEILEKLFVKFPNHPGIAHYIIHNYDYPELAPLALNTARRYAKIAPASAHAQHMPSHIFTRLGLWEESISSNLRSTEAAKCYAENLFQESHWDEELHGMDYLVYAYLQIGDNNKAMELYNYLTSINDVFPANFKVAYCGAAIPTRLALENRDWATASQLELPKINIDWSIFPWQVAILHFGRSLGFSNSGNVASAIAELGILESLRQKLLIGENIYEAGQVEIQINAAKAWVELAKGNKPDALEFMLRASELENKTSKHAVTPGEVLPADELLGDLYLRLNKPIEALEAYEFSLKGHPNKFNSLYGAAIASKKIGDVAKAKSYFEVLIKMTEHVVSNRPELMEAKQFLAQTEEIL